MKTNLGASGYIAVKAPARAATTGAITLSGTQTIDGVALVVGDRVLVKDQASQPTNGIYVVQSGAWHRADDCDSSSQVLADMMVLIEEGSTQAETAWVLATNNPIVLGTTNLSFTQLSGGGGGGGGGGYDRIQEEGANLTQRTTLNFVGAALTATDNAGSTRTDVTLSQSPASASVVGTGRTVTAGAGLTGGGALSSDITLNVIANADGSIVVNANDIQVGVLASDAQHGTRGGGTQHAVAVASGAAGFLSGADKAKLDGIPSDAVTGARTLTAGAGLTGGGDLSADRTLAVGANADGSIVVNADDIQVGVLATDAQHGNRGGGAIHSAATTSTAGFMSSSDKTKLDAIVIARRDLGAVEFDEPNNSDWTVNAFAALATDGTNARLLVRRFDDTTEEGVGFDLYIPTGVTSLTFRFISAAVSAPGGAAGVVPKLYCSTIRDNNTVAAWDSGTVMTTIDIPTNTNWQYDSQTIALSSLSLTAGTRVYFELTRVGANASDTLTGDWKLLSLNIEMT